MNDLYFKEQNELSDMSTRNAKILLLLVFIARGTSFLFSKTLLTELPPLSIIAVRFTLSFLILAVLFWNKLRNSGKAELSGGIQLGVLYTLSMVTEMYALRLIDTGVCSLIENMAIVLVPIITAILTRTLPKKKTVFCAVLAVIGVGFLSVTQRVSRGGGLGILLAVATAVIYACCIMRTKIVSKDADPLAIGIIQLGIMGLCCTILSLLTGTFEIPHTGRQWFLIGMLILVCSCFGFAFQPVAQKYLPAETAAVFTVANPLTASFMGIVILGEKISTAKVIGFLLILTSLVVYNLDSVRDSEDHDRR